MRWVPVGKSVFNLYRYAEVSKSANERYMGALSAVVPLHDCVKELEQLAQPVHDGQNRRSGFNPLSPEGTNCLVIIPGHRKRRKRRAQK
ncbi:MAG: hypothetical protein ACK41Q_02725 [Candidatus Brocadia sp.]